MKIIPKNITIYWRLLNLKRKRRAEGSFDGIGYNEETGFTRSEPMEITWDSLQKKLCPKGKAAAKENSKFTHQPMLMVMLFKFVKAKLV